MATQAYQSDNHRLLKVRQEGFALLEFFGPARRPGNKLPATHHPGVDDHHPNNVYRRNRLYNKLEYSGQPVELRSSKEAAEFYGGYQSFGVYQKGLQSCQIEPPVDIDEAARLYGNKLIVEHRIGKPNRHGNGVYY